MSTNNYTNIAIYVIGGLIIAGISLYLLHKSSDFKKKTQQGTKTNNKPDSHVKILSDLKKNEGINKESCVSLIEIASHMKLVVGYFSGNLNALRNIVQNEPDGLEANLFENISLTLLAHGDDFLIKWHNDFMKDKAMWSVSDFKEKAKSFLSIIELCGVEVVSEQDIAWNKGLSLKYNTLSSISEGELCQVVMPFWRWQGRILEKGLVKVN